MMPLQGRCLIKIGQSPKGKQILKLGINFSWVLIWESFYGCKFIAVIRLNSSNHGCIFKLFDKPQKLPDEDKISSAKYILSVLGCRVLTHLDGEMCRFFRRLGQWGGDFGQKNARGAK